MRLDLVAAFEPDVEALCRGGQWHEIERTNLELLHPERDTTEQIVTAWRVDTPRPGTTDR